MEGPAPLGQRPSGRLCDAGDRERDPRRHRPGREHPRQHAGIALLDQVAEHTGGIVDKALVDQGFKNAVVAHGTALGIDVEIVERNPQETGFVPQSKRRRVEQTYGILIPHRRLVRDHEHRPASSASRVYWAMTHVMARRLTSANTPTWREPQAVAA